MAKKGFFKVPCGFGENRQTFETKFKKKILVIFLCLFPGQKKIFCVAEISAQKYASLKNQVSLF